VPSLDRLSRSLADLIQIVTTLRRQGVGFKSMHEALDTTTPGGRLVFHVFAALTEFIRELIVEGTREGLDAARAWRAPRPAPGHDRRADPPRPRPADPSGQHRLFHSPAARRQPCHHLQVRP
jgi:DNA invertase Pin-like site-specific DNA recombinase